MENYIVINGRKAELTEDQLKKLGIAISKRERVGQDEYYYYVGLGGGVCEWTDGHFEADDKLYESYNYFTSRDEAEAYARVLDTEKELRHFAEDHNKIEFDWEDDLEKKWYMRYDCINDAIMVDFCFYFKNGRTIYFAGEDIAKAAIKKIGEHRIKEYFKYEW